MSDAYLDHMLGDKEQVILVDRQHWIVLVQAIFLEIILVVAILAAVALGFIFMNSVFFFFGLVLLIIPIVSMLRDILKWNYHKFVVTNRWTSQT